MSAFISDNNILSKKYVLLLNNLVGYASDMEKLIKIFIHLGYDVDEPVSNVSYNKLKEALKNFKTKKHSDSAFIIWYGDGWIWGLYSHNRSFCSSF